MDWRLEFVYGNECWLIINMSVVKKFLEQLQGHGDNCGVGRVLP